MHADGFINQTSTSQAFRRLWCLGQCSRTKSYATFSTCSLSAEPCARNRKVVTPHPKPQNPKLQTQHPEHYTLSTAQCNCRVVLLFDIVSSLFFTFTWLFHIGIVHTVVITTTVIDIFMVWSLSLICVLCSLTFLIEIIIILLLRNLDPGNRNP